MVDLLEHHVDAYVRALRREVTQSIWRILRTGLITVLAVLLGGGAVLTAVIYELGKTPWQPLALLSYATLVLAALAAAAAAIALHLSFSILRGIERAAKYVVEELRRAEGELVHSVTSAPHAPSGAPQLPRDWPPT